MKVALLVVLGCVVALGGAVAGLVAPRLEPKQEAPPQPPPVAPAPPGKTFTVPTAEPSVGDFGLLSLPAQPDAPTQVIDFYRIYEGSHKGDVVVWLQNVSDRSIGYVTYRLHARTRADGGRVTHESIVGAGSPQRYLVGSDISVKQPPASPGERLVIVIPRRTFEVAEREAYGDDVNEGEDAPELVFDHAE